MSLDTQGAYYPKPLSTATCTALCLSWLSCRMVRARHLPHGGCGGHGCEGNSAKSAWRPFYSHAIAAVHCDGTRDQNRRRGPHLQGRHVHMPKARSVPRPHEVHPHGGWRPRGEGAWGWQEGAGWAGQGLKQVQRTTGICLDARKVERLLGRGTA